MTDFPEFQNERTSKARKDHKCCECDGIIFKGFAHKAVTGKWNGAVQTFRMHIACSQIAENARDFFTTEVGLFEDEIFGFGELVEAAREDADCGDYIPPYWPSGVWISRGALRQHAAKASALPSSEERSDTASPLVRAGA